jgi:adenylate cyclase
LDGTAPIAYLETQINGETRKFAIPGDVALCIGRGGTAGVVLDDESVSRRHALLQRADGDQYYITDLGSRNGTQLNQKHISAPAILRPGDRISIGKYTLTFFHESLAPAADPEGEGGSTSVSFVPKLITVMVADIRDFTPLARRVKPETLSMVTGTLFREGGRVLQERGAWAQKYIGDAVMAVWLHSDLAPTSGELWPIFDSISQLIAIASSLQPTLGLDTAIRLGVGINTGLASVGNVGSAASADYTAIGDVVNKAFRLEASTRELGCDLALGQETFNLLGSSTVAGQIFAPRTVNLKGYEEAAVAYTTMQIYLPTLLGSFRQRSRF